MQRRGQIASMVSQGRTIAIISYNRRPGDRIIGRNARGPAVEVPEARRATLFPKLSLQLN